MSYGYGWKLSTVQLCRRFVTDCQLKFNYQTHLSLIQDCARSRSLEPGKSLHEQLLRSGEHVGLVLSNFLVLMYGNCGCPQDAWKTFESMEGRNVFSWNMIVTAYARNGHLSLAEAVLQKMPQQSTVSCNVIITGYVSNRLLRKARNIFDQMPEADVITWTALIAGYTQQGEYDQAIWLFRSMCLIGVRPDTVSFISILEACSSLKDARYAHSYILEAGLVIESQLATALLTMYGRIQRPEQARSVFDTMRNRCVVAWTSMVTAYAQNRQVERAKELFDKMPERDVISWTVLFVELAQEGKLETAREMFDAIPVRSVISWNAMIAAYAQNGLGDEALEVFKAMDMEGVETSHATFVTTLDACACSSSKSASGTVKFILNEFFASGFPVNVKIGTGLINLYGKFGDLDSARQIFLNMEERNYICWTSMIGALAQNSCIKEAMESLFCMNLEGFSPNEITFRTLLGACSHAGLLNSCLELFVSSIQDYEVPLSLDRYGCVVDVLGRVGKVGEAGELISEMPFQPDPVSWTALLGACRVQEELSLGEYAAKRMMELDGGKDTPYVVLSQLYSSG